VVLINQVSEYIIGAGGKRLRRCCCCSPRARSAIAARMRTSSPAVVEFIHTATLLHDDVVDESDLRRGRRTANAVWGNAASVLVGDFLYSRSFQLMVELDRMEVMRILADTTNQIAEGEVLQLLHVRNPDTDEAAYLRVIERKTPSCSPPPRAWAHCSPARCEDLRCDARVRPASLAMRSRSPTTCSTIPPTPTRWARNLGDDLAEGKATLPLITPSHTATRPRAHRCATRSSMATSMRCRWWSKRSAATGRARLFTFACDAVRGRRGGGARRHPAERCAGCLARPGALLGRPRR
jgi:octaprenyl-diphosphate synthase